MDILVSGSMAYDRIMDFEGKFSDHILPDQLDNINVSFTVNSLTENFGGTAGNIAYSLSLLGEKPRILATGKVSSWRAQSTGLMSRALPRIAPAQLTLLSPRFLARLCR